MQLIRRLDRVRRTDDGFSLIELMAAMAIGGVVLTALMGVFINGVRATTGIQNRVDDSGRARYASDRIVRLLDSQVCAQLVATSDIATPPVFVGSTQNSMTFYGDLSGASGTPRKFTITYVPQAGSTPGKVTIDTYAYNTTAKAWTTKVGPTNTLVSDVVPFRDAGGVVQPFFTYYPYYTSTTVPQGAAVGDVASSGAATPLSTTDAPTIVKVGVRFGTASSTSHRDDKTHAYVSASGTLSTFNADPIAPSACP
jgi:prepilin-type N-terminal cleavage/methylation domain-containing protein